MSTAEAAPRDAARLRAFLGTWDVQGVMIGPDDRQPISGVWQYTEATDGWGVIGDMTTEIGGIRITEVELIGLDAIDGRIHMFSMNRFAIRDHVGGWEEATLVTRFISDGGGRTEEEIRLHFPEPDHMEATVHEHVDGQLVLTTELTLRRR